MVLFWGDLDATPRAPRSQGVRAVEVPRNHTEEKTEVQKREMTDSRTHGARNVEAKPESLALEGPAPFLLCDAAVGPSVQGPHEPRVPGTAPLFLPSLLVASSRNMGGCSQKK